MTTRTTIAPVSRRGLNTARWGHWGLQEGQSLRLGALKAAQPLSTPPVPPAVTPGSAPAPVLIQILRGGGALLPTPDAQVRGKEKSPSHPQIKVRVALCLWLWVSNLSFVFQDMDPNSQNVDLNREGTQGSRVRERDAPDGTGHCQWGEQ